mgnify:FL=1
MGLSTYTNKIALASLVMMWWIVKVRYLRDGICYT